MQQQSEIGMRPTSRLSFEFPSKPTSPSAGLHVAALAVSGTNLFAGTQAGGVFRSVDNAASWVSMGYGLTGGGLRALAFDADAGRE